MGFVYPRQLARDSASLIGPHSFLIRDARKLHSNPAEPPPVRPPYRRGPAALISAASVAGCSRRLRRDRAIPAMFARHVGAGRPRYSLPSAGPTFPWVLHPPAPRRGRAGLCRPGREGRRFDVPATMLPFSMKHSPAEHPHLSQRAGPGENGPYALCEIFIQSRRRDLPH